MARLTKKQASYVILSGSFVIVLAFVLFFRPQHLYSPLPSKTSQAPTVPHVEQPGTRLPSEVLDLQNWYLTLPVDSNHDGIADEIKQPELANYVGAPYFLTIKDNTGVAFIATAGGARTTGSNFARSELREMTDDGKTEAAWSPAKGIHSLAVRQAVLHLPAKHPAVVIAQIHDANEGVFFVRLEGSRMFVRADNHDIGTLMSNYKLGTPYNLVITVADNHIKVLLNGKQKVDYMRGGSGFYFKTGCYIQTNVSSYHEAPDQFAETVIYNLSVTHT